MLFIYFWLCWVLVAAWACFSCVKRGLLFLVVVSLVAEHRPRVCGVRELQHVGSETMAYGL